MSQPGWIKIHRALMDHWSSSEPEALAVWVRMLCEANYEEKTTLVYGQLVTVKRGQLIFGLEKFSARSGVSVKKLRRIVDMLVSDGMLGRQVMQRFSMLTITCYDKYQDMGKQEASIGQAEGNRRATPKEGNKSRSKESTMSSELDDGVSAVIEKINNITGKKLMASTKAHRENISARLREGHSVKDLISVVEVKAAEWMGTKYEAYLVPSTLFTPKNFARYLSESSIAARTMTAEDVVQSYHDELPEMPRVDYITRELRASITEFCLKSGFNAAKLKKYFDYIRESCRWVMDERYHKDFRFLINLETLNRAVNGTLSNRSE